MFMVHDKCAITIKSVSEPACRSLSFDTPSQNVTAADMTPTPMVNPFHFHKPRRFCGRHHLVGKGVSMFDLRHAANLASYCERNNLINVYMKIGNPYQRRHSLNLFLSKDTIIDDTKSVLKDVILDKDTLAGV
jgi:hypothetical protein